MCSLCAVHTLLKGQFGVQCFDFVLVKMTLSLLCSSLDCDPLNAKVP